MKFHFRFRFGKSFPSFAVSFLMTFLLLNIVKANQTYAQREGQEFRIAQGQNIPVQGGIPRDKEEWDIEDYNKINASPPSETLEVIQYLEPRLESLPSPYIYEYANRLMELDEAKALVWLQVARFRARYDALLCADTSSRSGIVFGPQAYPEIHALLQDKAKYLASLEEAMEIEKSFPEESKPMWICVHGGQNVLSGMKGETFTDWQIPAEERNEKREEVRALFLKKFNQLTAEINK